MRINKPLKTRDVVEYLMPKYAKGRTLDIGAGSAKYKHIIEKYVSDYKTCDIREGENIGYIEDATKLSFADNSYDTILSFQVLEHVDSPDKMLSEIYRCLKPGGVCILTVPFLLPQHNDPGDYQRYTKMGLKKIFEDHNFTVLECDSCGDLFAVLGEFTRFLYLNPYSNKKPGRIRRKIITIITEFLNYLSALNFLKNSNFYGGVYIAARK